MSTVYVDTSVLGRVLRDERGTPAIVRDLHLFEQRAASRLLRVELRRLGLREGMLAHVDTLLDRIALIPLDDQILTAAETTMPSGVATLDAIHLATALRLAEAGELDALMTYDEQLANAAREHGIEVLSPS
jgi:uncharacterized protein